MQIAKSMNDPKRAAKFMDEERKSEDNAAKDLGKETARLAGMKKGGKVRTTGKRTLHKGEIVARKCKSRSSGRR
jgi:hypothetical protein